MNATTISAMSLERGACLWRLDVCGRFALFDAGRNEITLKSRKCRALLAYLAAQPGERISRERLTDLFWGDRFEAQARLSLRQCLFEIRKTAGESLISSDREHLWIEASALELIDSGGEPFAGLSGITPEYDEWLRVERERRTGETFALLKIDVEQLLASGRGAEALPLIERMRRIDPLHECWIRLAMQADRQAGNPAGIERRFNEFSQMLHHELGVPPAGETRALRDRLLGELASGPEPEPESRGATAIPASPDAKQAPHRRAAWFDRIAALERKKRLAFGLAVIVPLILIAVSARYAVTEQRRQAEGMAEFMLGNFKDRIEPTGKIDAIEGVADRVVDYYKDSSNSELSDSELRQRSKALSLLGEVQDLRGNTGAAGRFFVLAAAGTAEAVRRNPGDPQRLFDHAQNVFWIGEIARQRGRVDEAETAYRQYKQLADQMMAIDPDNLKWRMEVLYANENLGIVLLSKRHFTEARLQFQNALHPMESAASIDQSKIDYQKEVGMLLAWLGDANRAEGRYKEAVAARQQQLGVLEKLDGKGGEDTGVAGQLIPAHEGLGVLYREQGYIDRAIEEDRLALAEAERLMSIEPANSQWTGSMANVRLDLARNLLSQGRRGDAAGETAAACSAADELIHRDRTVTRWRILQTRCFAAESKLALNSGASERALNLAQKSLAAAGAQNSGDPASDRYGVAAAYRLVGDIQQRSGNIAAARAAWLSGLAQLPGGVAETPWEMDDRAQLLARLGRASEAQPINARLTAMGYRMQA